MPESNFSIDGKEIVVRIIKYVLEGAMVGIAAALIPKQKPSLEEILTIALVAAATFSILDLFSPSISTSTRLGVGAALGAGIVGGIPIKH
jgi:ABC-type Co2+ transport system permease subunit